MTPAEIILSGAVALMGGGGSAGYFGGGGEAGGGYDGWGAGGINYLDNTRISSALIGISSGTDHSLVRNRCKVILS